MNGRDQVAAGLVLATAAFAALAVGGAPRWAACAAAALGVASALPYIGSRRGLRRPGALLVFLGAALAVTALQVVPLPSFLVGLLSPAKLELVRQNAAALGEEAPALMALSYDPAATLLEVARLVGYLGVAYAALRVAASGRGRRLLAMGLAGLGALMVLIVAAHKMLAATALYGLYQPRFASPIYLAPFLNPNHLAGFLALLAPLSLGLAVQSSGVSRLAWGAASVAIAGVSLLAASRAGTIVLVIGLGVAAALIVIPRVRESGQPRERSAIIGGAIVLACVVVLVGALAGRDAWNQIVATKGNEVAAHEGKLAAWKASMPLLAENWATGVGRGGFETAFTSLHGSPGNVFSHVENEYLQAGLDWGIPLAAVIGVLLILLVRRIASRWREGPIEAGALGGLLAIALHNTLDFSLSMPGVAVLAVVALALVARGSLTRAGAPGLRLRRIGAAVSAAAVVALAATPLARSARDDADRLADASARGTLELEDARAAWQRHPADHLAAGYTATALLARRDSRAIAVVSRALILNPRHPDLHLLAARLLLASQAPTQALIEYRLAVRYAQPGAIEELIGELLHRFPDDAVAVRGLPEDPEVFRYVVSRLIKAKREPLALAYARQVAALYPRRGEAWREVSRLAGRQGDQQLAVRAGQEAVRVEPDAESAALLASAQREAGKPEAAIETLERALDESYPTSRTVTVVELLRHLARAQMAAGRPDEAREVLMRALGLAGTSRPRAAAIHYTLATLEKAQGNPHRAAWHREQAALLSGK